LHYTITLNPITMYRLQFQYTPKCNRFYHYHNGSYNPEPLPSCNGIYFIGTFKTHSDAIIEAINQLALLSTNPEITIDFLAIAHELSSEGNKLITNEFFSVTITFHKEITQ
jgi:hypothetical protein